METIGFISGLITISQTAGTIGALVFKLKSLWNRIDEIPERIHDRLVEIEFLGTILSGIDTEFQRANLDHETCNLLGAVNCARYFQEAFDALSSIIKDFDNEINCAKPIMKKLVSTRIIMKKRKIEKLEDRLAQALKLLKISHSYYYIAIGRASLEVNTKVLSLLQKDRHLLSFEQINSCDQTIETFDDTSQESMQSNQSSRLSPPRLINKITFSFLLGRLSISTSSRECFYSADFQPKNWLSDKIYGLSMCRSLQQFTFRYYNIRPTNSAIFRCIRNRDLPGMLRLFSNRLASPYDRDQDGLSLLHHAVATKDIVLCNELLDLGLDACVDEKIETHFTPRETAFLCSLWSVRDTTKDRILYLDIFPRCHRDADSLEDRRFFLFGCSSGTYDLNFLTYFQRSIIPSFYQLPMSDRFELTRAYCCTSLPQNHPNPTIFRFLIKDGHVLHSDDLSLSNRVGQSIVHTVAATFGRVCRMALSSQTDRHGDRVVEWDNIIKEVITLSDPQHLHSMEDFQHRYPVDIDSLISHARWSGTPFLSLIRGCCLDDYLKAELDTSFIETRWRLVTAYVTQRWMEKLNDYGVDLEEYWRTEKRIMDELARNQPKSLEYRLNITQWSPNEQEYFKEVVLFRLCDIEPRESLESWKLVWESVPNVPGLEAVLSKSEENPRVSSSGVAIMPGSWPE